MPYAWQSVEEAAVTLGISARTLHRRISKGEVETRLANGRREVLVCLPDEEPEAVEGEVTDIPEQAFSTAPIEPEPQVAAPPPSGVQPTPEPQPSINPDLGTAMVLAEKDMALANERVRRTELALAAFQHTSQILQREAGRSRISARLAWAAVAILSVGVYVAVGWTASRVTRAKADNEHLASQLQGVSAAAEEKQTEVQQLREELAKYQQAAARAQGELEATRTSLQEAKASLAVKKPATQPSFFEKLVRMNFEN